MKHLLAGVSWAEMLCGFCLRNSDPPMYNVYILCAMTTSFIVSKRGACDSEICLNYFNYGIHK